jgi:mono/diheme cytochrome c family protein
MTKEFEMRINSVGNLALTLAFLLSASSIASSADGASLYKSKCAGCHGAQGEGKPAMKAPALKGTSKSAEEIAAHLTKGKPESKPPHNKGMSGINEAKAKMIAEYVRGIK